MDEKQVVKLYTVDKWTLRHIADHLGTDHHRIKRILTSHDIEITQKGRSRKPFTDEHRRKISASSRGRKAWNEGQSMSESYRRANMAGKLDTSIDLGRYPDYERLKFLTHFLSKHKQHIGYDDPARKAFLDKFYFDPVFNALYDQWIEHGKDKWYRPTLDHIRPKSNGGSWSLDNLQFLTWFENRAKADMSSAEWDQFKECTNTHSALFL